MPGSGFQECPMSDQRRWPKLLNGLSPGLYLLPFRCIDYRENSILGVVVMYNLSWSLIIRDFGILKYNFIPYINPTLWSLALSCFSRTMESRIWWFPVGATRHAVGRNPDVSAAPQRAEGSGP